MPTAASTPLQRQLNGHNGQTAVNGVNGHGLPHSPSNDIDVIIVGAGPVGLLLALRLAQKNIRCVLLEKDSGLNLAPRAIGYYGPVHHVFQEAGIFDQVAEEGMPCGGYAWRKAPVDDGKGGKKLGPVVGWNVMSRPNAEGNYEVGHYSIQLAQSRLSEILVERLHQTGMCDMLWNHELTSLSQDDSGVCVDVNTPDGQKSIKAQYLVGCDGGKSIIRKLLGIKFSGHSWPERFIATDVWRTTGEVADPPVHFTMDRKYWGVATPLERVEEGKPGLWRYSMAVPLYQDDGTTILTDEEVVAPEYIDSLLLRQMDGPRPSDHQVVRKSLYKMHQLLASTMHRGQCLLAGDSAHINNPIGGLGLCTGILDADAISQAFEIVFASSNDDVRSVDPQVVFSRYSAERRRVFQNIIHPFSSANKTRLHGADPDDTAREDWYIQALVRGDPEELKDIHRPLFENWRTDLWKCIFTSRPEKRVSHVVNGNSH